jgi:hypothetical protein
LQQVHLLVPYPEAGIVSRLRGVASDLQTEHTGDGIEVRGLLPEAEAQRYAAYAVDDGAAGHD